MNDIKSLQYVFGENIIDRTVKSGDDLIILAHNTLSGDLYEFNDIGSEIYLRLKKNMPIKDILQELAEEYEADEAEILEDVRLFINRVMELGIIRIAEK